MSRYKVKRKIDIPSLQEVMGEVDKHEFIKPETHGALKIQRMSTNKEASEALNSEGEKVEDDI